MSKFHTAKGTEENNYLDPILFKNMFNSPYANIFNETKFKPGRTDPLKMNRENMDYTLDNAEVFGMQLAQAMDLNGDGYVGQDDAMLILKYYAMAQTGEEEDKENEYFNRIFKDTTTLNKARGVVYSDKSKIDGSETNESEIDGHTVYNYDYVGPNEGVPYYTKKGRFDHIITFLQDDEVTLSVPCEHFKHDLRFWDTDGETEYRKSERYDCYLVLFNSFGIGKNSEEKRYFEKYTNDKDTCIKIWKEKIEILTLAEKYGVLDASSASTILGYINETTEIYLDQQYNCCISVQALAPFLNELIAGVNLLMPQYARRVEVEDLDENFWVIGQALTYLMNTDYRSTVDISNLERQIKIERKTIVDNEADIILSKNPATNTETVYTKPVKSIEIKDFNIDDKDLKDYTAIIGIPVDPSAGTARNLIKNSSSTNVDLHVNVINGDLDLTALSHAEILLYHDGFGMTAIVNGY